MKRKKQFLALLMALVFVFGLSACGGGGGADGESDSPPSSEESASGADSISDTMTSEDNKYEAAMVTDLAQLKDKSFNQGTWDGVKQYAHENGLSYKYYQPAGGSEATDTDRYDAFISAINNGAKIIVAPGYLQYDALYKAAQEYPDVKFVFIDGWDVGLDNVSGVYYHEEQSGFMAGYASVKDGLTKLGFTGGGGGSNPAVNRCGYGFAQGASAAAAELGVDVELKYSYLYGESYSASDALQTQINGWYSSGTEVVFAYGGAMCNSVFAAAAANNAWAIGGDVDQSGDSDTVLTSALKGLTSSVGLALTKYYSNEWDDIKGDSQLGIHEDAVGLPMETSRFTEFGRDDYDAIVDAMKTGSVAIDADFEEFLAGSKELPNVTVTFIK
jgi:basic membrane protein A